MTTTAIIVMLLAIGQGWLMVHEVTKSRNAWIIACVWAAVAIGATIFSFVAK